MQKQDILIAEKCTEITAVKKFVRKLHTNLRGSKKSSHELIGSSRMLLNAINPPMWAVDHLDKMDLDFHIDNSQLTIEAFICELGVRKKDTDKLEASGYGVGPQSHLRSMYEITVPEMVATPAGQAALKSMKADTWDRRYVDNVKASKMEVDFGFVQSVYASSEVWMRVPVTLYFDFLWKHSPKYIGKDAVRQLFTAFEGLGKKIVNLEELIIKPQKSSGKAAPLEARWEVVQEMALEEANPAAAIVAGDFAFNRGGPAF